MSGFTGIESQSYVLVWAITTVCNSSRDSVTVSIPCPLPNAGPNQLEVPGDTTTLQGNTPWIGSGVWSIMQGSGGNITNPTDPSSTFTGIQAQNYILRWTVSSPNCEAHVDDVNITFECNPQPTQANAGPDQLNVAGVTATMAGNTPTEGTGVWNIVSGANGIIAQPANPGSMFTGTNGTTYNLQWNISNSCGTSSDDVTISFAAFSCGNSFQDTRDGKAYNTVQSGSQCWMRQNLNYATGSSYCLGGNPTNCDNYGRQYDWNTASSACPTGWHLPTDAEWCTLATAIDGSVKCAATTATGTDAGGKMKETGTTYWQSPNTGATNSSGFSGRGGGSTIGNIGQRGSFWTSTTYGSNKWSWELLYNDARIYHNNYSTSNSMSVRCLKT